MKKPSWMVNQPPINLIAVDLPIKDGDFPVRYGRLSYVWQTNLFG